MLHRNALIAICATFCAVAVGAGLFVANLSKQNGLIAQQPGISATSLPTSIAGLPPTPIADEPIADAPTTASEPTPSSAAIEVLDPAEPTLTTPPTAASIPAAPTAAPIGTATTYIEYTVQKGDLLNDIAKKHNVTTKDILALNQISNADSLTVGQVIRIPKI